MSPQNKKMAPSSRQPLNGQGVLRISGEDFKGTLRMASLNVGSMAERSREVVAMLRRRRVDICGVQEVRYINQETKVIGSNEEKYKFYWSGGSEKQGGV